MTNNIALNQAADLSALVKFKPDSLVIVDGEHLQVTTTTNQVYVFEGIFTLDAGQIVAGDVTGYSVYASAAALAGDATPILSASTETDTVPAANLYTALHANDYTTVQSLLYAADQVLIGSGGKDTLYGGAGNDTFIGGLGADKFIGGEGNDVYNLAINSTNHTTITVEDTITENANQGTDTVQLVLSGAAGSDILFNPGVAGAYTLGANLENLSAMGLTDSFKLTGNTLNNIIIGGNGNDTLDGGTGADQLQGGNGSDTYIVDNTGDIVNDGGTGLGDVDTVIVKFAGTTGDTPGTLIQLDNPGFDPSIATIHYQGVENLTISGSGNFNVTGNSAANVIQGGAGNDALSGGAAGFDTLVGGAGSDVLTASADGAILDGGTGADSLIGGAGNDLFILDNAGDSFTSGGGIDTVGANFSINLLNDARFVNINNADLTGTAALNITGNGNANVLFGNDGNNTLDGGAGADSMVGLKGNDTYIVDNTGDVVDDNGPGTGGGTDTVLSSVTYTLANGNGIENLTLANGAGSINATGNELANTLTGNDGNNTLDGGAGADKLVGGAGDDTYVVNLINSGTTLKLEDTVTETAGTTNGNDTLQLHYSGSAPSGGTVTIAPVTGVENIDASDVHNVGVYLKGDANSNTLTGTDGNDTLDGGSGGTDVLIGGAGDDTYILSANNGPTITDTSGNDTVVININLAPGISGVPIDISAFTGIENLTMKGTGAVNLVGDGNDNILIGNASVNVLVGNAGDDTLDGGAGADTMVGGEGSDTYYIDNANDMVSDTGSTGVDTVFSTTSVNLNDATRFTGIENAGLTGTAAGNLTGRDGEVNVLTGNDGANTLNGGTGADTMIGGKGNDVYVVDNASDSVSEDAGAGTDTVQSSVSYTLGANVENLTLTDLAVSGTGNELANTITGNAGDNTLTGGGGADKLIGGDGDDTYVVNLIASGTGLKLEDTIMETAGAHGNDTLHLVYSGASPSAAVTISTTTGIENIDASDVTTPMQLTLKGDAGVNILTGSDATVGFVTLDGGAGADTMIGGSGVTTFVVDNVNDVVQAGTGLGAINILDWNVNNTGAVQTLHTTDYPGFYSIQVGGTGLYNLIGDNSGHLLVGNASVNTLTGGAGDDQLDGRGGADVMIGGDGSDTYYVDNINDVVSETGSTGTDTVISTLSVDLTSSRFAGIENATLTGNTAGNLTGNDSDNVLTGNGGANTLNGGAGDDAMLGGAGNDVYFVDSAGDTVDESSVTGDAGGIDTVNASVTYELGQYLENLTLTGSADIDGFGNDLKNTLVGNDGDNTLQGYDGADVMKGGLGDDTYFSELSVTGNKLALADTITENANAGNDTLHLYASGSVPLTASGTITLANNVENLDASDNTLNGVKLNFTGNASDNVITGTTGDNTLDGGAGNDTLFGNGGHDVLKGGAGDDVLIVTGDPDQGVVLTGGTGNDTFVIDSPTVSTSISDFQTGDSVIFAGNLNLTLAAADTTTTYTSVEDAVTALSASAADDTITFFHVGKDGYLYVKDSGSGTVDYDGTVVQLAGHSAPITAVQVIGENEAAATNTLQFNPLTGQSLAVQAALSTSHDTDSFTFHASNAGVTAVKLTLPTEPTYVSDAQYQATVTDANGTLVGHYSVGQDGEIIVPTVGAGDYTVTIAATDATHYNAGNYTVQAQVLEPNDHGFVSEGDTVTSSGAVSVSGGPQLHAVHLDAGQLYTFDATSTSDLDLKLKVYSADGKLLQTADDTLLRDGEGSEFQSLNPHLGFVASQSGTYYVAVEAVHDLNNLIKAEGQDDGILSFNDSNTSFVGNYGTDVATSGNYTLTITGQDTDAVIGELAHNQSWNPDGATTPTTIYYSFAGPGAGLAADGHTSDLNGHASTALSTAQQNAIETLLGQYEALTNITFVEDTSSAHAGNRLVFALDTVGATAGDTNLDVHNYNQFDAEITQATIPELISSSDIVLHATANADFTTGDSTDALNYGILAALGINPLDNTLPPALDSSDYTLLSDNNDFFASHSPTTLQVADIAVLQAEYGVNATHNAGGTTYVFDSSHEYFLTIDDQSGNDTFDAHSLSLDSLITLQDGATSSIGIQGALEGYTSAELHNATIPGEALDQAYTNVTIAQGTIIENAIGGSGNDVIYGNDANNSLTGNAGADRLYGGDGNDFLDGGAGQDLLVGGLGHDTLTGGADNDVFRLEGGFSDDNSATITDFSSGHDKIQLADILDTTNFTADHFVLGTAATASDQVIYDQTTGSLYYDADGAGGEAAVLLATLTAHPTLSFDDLVAIHTATAVL